MSKLLGKAEKDHLKDLAWQGRAIAEKDHANDLDREAAMHEFGNKLPRGEAEEKAYGDYRKDQHARAAAHHLQGMKAAQASGNMDEARKHGILYDQHMKGLGHESSIGHVPSSVSRYVAEDDKGPYKFKAHSGDRFVLDKSEDTMADTKTKQPKRLSNQSTGDCSCGCGRAAYPYKTKALDGYVDAAPECAEKVLRDAIANKSEDTMADDKLEKAKESKPTPRQLENRGNKNLLVFDPKKGKYVVETKKKIKKDVAFMGAAEKELEKDAATHALRNVVLGHSTPKNSPAVMPGSSPQIVGSDSAFGAKDKPVSKAETDEHLHLLYKAARAVLDGVLKKKEESKSH